MDQIYIISAPLEAGTDTRNREASSPPPPPPLPLPPPPRPPLPPPPQPRVAAASAAAAGPGRASHLFSARAYSARSDLPLRALRLRGARDHGARAGPRVPPGRAAGHSCVSACRRPALRLRRAQRALSLARSHGRALLASRRGCAGPDPVRVRGARAAGGRRAHARAGLCGACEAQRTSRSSLARAQSAPARACARSCTSMCTRPSLCAG